MSDVATLSPSRSLEVTQPPTLAPDAMKLLQESKLPPDVQRAVIRIVQSRHKHDEIYEKLARYCDPTRPLNEPDPDRIYAMSYIFKAEQFIKNHRSPELAAGYMHEHALLLERNASQYARLSETYGKEIDRLAAARQYIEPLKTEEEKALPIKLDGLRLQIFRLTNGKEAGIDALYRERSDIVADMQQRVPDAALRNAIHQQAEAQRWLMNARHEAMKYGTPNAPRVTDTETAMANQAYADAQNLIKSGLSTGRAAEMLRDRTLLDREHAGVLTAGLSQHRPIIEKAPESQEAAAAREALKKLLESSAAHYAGAHRALNAPSSPAPLLPVAPPQPSRRRE